MPTLGLTHFHGAMAVQRATYCTIFNPQNPVASTKYVIYNHAHSDWIKLDKGDLTLPFNERVDGSNPSSPKFLSRLFQNTFIGQIVATVS